MFNTPMPAIAMKREQEKKTWKEYKGFGKVGRNRISSTRGRGCQSIVVPKAIPSVLLQFLTLLMEHFLTSLFALAVVHNLPNAETPFNTVSPSCSGDHQP